MSPKRVAIFLGLLTSLSVVFGMIMMPAATLPTVAATPTPGNAINVEVRVDGFFGNQFKDVDELPGRTITFACQGVD